MARLLSLCWFSLLLTGFVAPVGAKAQSYLSRPVSLGHGVLRIDAGPSDYGYMDHGELNGSRGFRAVDRPGDAQLRLGLGAAYGVTSAFEVGGLLLPLQLSPDGDVGDLEFYGRFALSSVLALQATLQLPTQTDLGVGVGVPVKLPFGGGHRLETGIELEFIFADDPVANLDVPVAFSFSLTDAVFAGFRTGIFFAAMEEIAINLGIQAGVTIVGDLDLTGSLNFPRFLWTGPGDEVSFRGYQLIAGINAYLGG